MRRASVRLLAMLFFVSIAWSEAAQGATDLRLVPGGYTDVSPGRLDVVYIPNVPDVQWYYGCGPTSAGDVLAYWQTVRGASGLGDINDWESVIASSGHVNAFYGGGSRGNNANYNTLAEPDPASHAGVGAMDCIADFAGTSRNGVNNPATYGPTDNTNGGTKMWYYSGGSAGTLVAGRQYDDLAWGIKDYVEYKGGTATVSPYTWADFTWAMYTSEIDNNRPVLLGVDSDGDGGSDHFAVGFGYDPSSTEYLAYSEWGNYGEFYGSNSSRYETWQTSTGGSPQSWGVTTAITIGNVTGAGGGTTPEPSAVGLLLLGAVLFLQRRSTHRPAPPDESASK